MVRTGIPGQLEHSIAYAGSATITVAGYGRRGTVRIISLFWIYAGALEYLPPGRHPSIADFAASAFSGGLAAVFLVRRLWRGPYSGCLMWLWEPQ